MMKNIIRLFLIAGIVSSAAFLGASQAKNSTNSQVERCSSCDRQPKFVDFGKREKLFKCLTCKQVQYCNQKCQQHDWQRHKQVCKPYRGAEFVLNEDIQFGAKVLKKGDTVTFLDTIADLYEINDITDTDNHPMMHYKNIINRGMADLKSNNSPLINTREIYYVRYEGVIYYLHKSWLSLKPKAASKTTESGQTEQKMSKTPKAEVSVESKVAAESRASSSATLSSASQENKKNIDKIHWTMTEEEPSIRYWNSSCDTLKDLPEELAVDTLAYWLSNYDNDVAAIKKVIDSSKKMVAVAQQLKGKALASDEFLASSNPCAIAPDFILTEYRSEKLDALCRITKSNRIVDLYYIRLSYNEFNTLLSNQELVNKALQRVDKAKKTQENAQAYYTALRQQSSSSATKSESANSTKKKKKKKKKHRSSTQTTSSSTSSSQATSQSSSLSSSSSALQNQSTSSSNSSLSQVSLAASLNALNVQSSDPQIVYLGQQEIRKCANPLCKKPVEKITSCTLCWVAYCSDDCRKSDLKNHIDKKLCKAGLD